MGTSAATDVARRRAVPVLNVGWLGFEDEAAPVCVHHDLPLAPLHLLARVIAARATALGRFDRLAVEHGSAGRGFTSDPFAVGHDEEMVHALKQAGVAPLRKPAIHGGPGRQIVGKQSPSHPAPQHVEDRIHDLAQRPFSWPPTRVGSGIRGSAEPIRHPSNRFRIATHRGYAAAEWLGSTSRFQAGFNEP